MLDAKLVKPNVNKVSDKYSWGLYRFLKKCNKFRVLLVDDGSVINGEDYPSYMIFFEAHKEGNDSYGYWLKDIMQNRFLPTLTDRKRKDITGIFLEEYPRDGRCMFDRLHRGWWTMGEPRFEEISDATRKCKWCGATQTRVEKEVVKVYKEWVND